VSIVGLGAYDSNFTRTNIWAGTGVSVSLVETRAGQLRHMAAGRALISAITSMPPRATKRLSTDLDSQFLFVN